MSSLELYNYRLKMKIDQENDRTKFLSSQFPLVFSSINKLLLRKWNFLCSRNKLRSILIIIFLKIRKRRNDYISIVYLAWMLARICRRLCFVIRSLHFNKENLLNVFPCVTQDGNYEVYTVTSSSTSGIPGKKRRNYAEGERTMNTNRNFVK